MATRIYQRLVAKRREIRLAVISPAESRTVEIRCDLRVVSLHKSPRYSAISYVWGDAKNTLPILLNGSSWQVTDNLESLLRTGRALGYRLVWIDAICINQSCLAERAYQVSVMGSIYKKASEVLVWFGTDPDGSQALDMTDTTRSITITYEEASELEDCQQALTRYSNQAGAPARDRVLFLSVHQAQTPLLVFDIISLLADENIHLYQLPIFDASQLPFIIVTGKGRKVLHGFEAFIRNQWWRRIWVVQEVLLPDEVRITWGPFSIPWSTVANAAANFAKHHGSCCKGLAPYLAADDWAIFLKFRDIVQEIEHQRVQLREEGFQLSSLLHTFGSRRATDPRDKIYGLLGLVTDWDVSRTPRITADYAQSISTVYQSAVVSMIFDTFLAEILVMSGGERSLPGLPSWVPDWSVESVQNHSLDNVWRANRLVIHPLYAAWNGPGIETLWQDPVLVMAGCHVDIVQDVGETMTSSRENIEQTTVTVLEQWQHMLELPHQSDAEYVTKKCTMLEAFWRTMFGDIMFNVDNSMPVSVDRPRSVENYRRAVSEDELAWTWLWRWTKELATSPVRREGEHPPDLPPPPRPGMELIEVDFVFRMNCMNRKFFTTGNGYMGLGPPQAQPGDIVFVLFGTRVPFILRRHEDQYPVTFSPDDFGRKRAVREMTLSKPSYALIGDCFVHGVMDGEFNKINENGQLIFLR